MTSQDWMMAGAGAASAAALLALARVGLKGGALDHVQTCCFVCPRFDEVVACAIRQNVRTGQWNDVEACSAFTQPDKVLCGQDCRRLMNLGLLRPRTP